MSYTVPNDIYNVVHPIAQQQGVPDALWEDVVYVESSFNPKAHNPSGAYGLFQLLTPGGQGDNAIRAGYTVNDLYDPKINATYGMPAVASAWNNLKSSFNPNDLHWWEEFAAESGHPGGKAGQQYTDEVAQTLMNDYQSDNNPISNTIGAIQNAISNTDSALNFLQSLNVTNVQHALVKAGIFLVALLILIIGFVMVAKRPTQ